MTYRNDKQILYFSQVREQHGTNIVLRQEKGETINPIAYGRHYKQKREGLWHVYMNGSPLKDKNGKAILYNSKAQPGTKGFDYRFNNKKQKKR